MFDKSLDTPGLADVKVFVDHEGAEGPSLDYKEILTRIYDTTLHHCGRNTPQHGAGWRRENGLVCGLCNPMPR